MKRTCERCQQSEADLVCCGTSLCTDCRTYFHECEEPETPLFGSEAGALGGSCGDRGSDDGD